MLTGHFCRPSFISVVLENERTERFIFHINKYCFALYRHISSHFRKGLHFDKLISHSNYIREINRTFSVLEFIYIYGIFVVSGILLKIEIERKKKLQCRTIWRKFKFINHIKCLHNAYIYI